MNKKINLWSFILSLVCIGLFYLSTFAARISNTIFGIHPLKILFCIDLMALMLVAIGFSGVYDWKSMLRSIAALSITAGLAVFLAYVIFFGSLLQAL